MVDWHAVETIMAQTDSLIKLVHVMDGIYIWELISTAGYEWRLFNGQQPWRWTLWLYLGCKLFTLAVVVSNLTGFNVTSEIDCQAWIVSTYTFEYLASSLALSLYGLRTIAIWHRNTFITIFIAAISLANIAFWIHSITRAVAVWNPQFMSCVITQTHRGLPAALGTLITNALILLTMVFGLLCRQPAPHAVIRLFSKEGVFWLSLATIIQVLPSTFMALDLNDPMNLMFHTPAVIASTIGATRIYRSISQRNMGDLLEYWESSIDATTGELRFHRRIDAMSTKPSVAVPMNHLQKEGANRYVERFAAQDIKFDDTESVTGCPTPDAKGDLEDDCRPKAMA